MARALIGAVIVALVVSCLGVLNPKYTTLSIEADGAIRQNDNRYLLVDYHANPSLCTLQSPESFTVTGQMVDPQSLQIEPTASYKLTGIDQHPKLQSISVAKDDRTLARRTAISVRRDPVFTALPDGNVLIAEKNGTMEIFSSSGHLLKTFKIAQENFDSATTLPNGTVVFTAANQCIVLNVQSERVERNCQMLDTMFNCQSIVLSSGRILFAGGYDAHGRANSKTQVYDSTTNTIRNGPSLALSRLNPVLIPLPNDRVFVAGGYVGGDMFTPALLFNKIFGTEKHGTRRKRAETLQI